MKNYISVQVIQAEEMNKNERDGFHVIIPGGYESWVDKHYFESTSIELKEYKVKDLSEIDLDEEQYKIYQEYLELMSKITKITKIIRDLEIINNSDNNMVQQFNYMCGYSCMLVQRINEF